MILPSIELLHVVLSEEVKYKKLHLARELYINGKKLVYGRYYAYEYDEAADINIYEFAHRCVEWIKTQGTFELIIQTYPNVPCRLQLQSRTEKPFIVKIHEEAGTLPTDELSQLEAIFKACKWILNNKELV